MENKLKAATSYTIKTLNRCNIRTIMATGDNTLTAISVARQCKILNKHQDVYFGDIVNERLVWKSQAGGDDQEDITQSEIQLKEFDQDEINVPWESHPEEVGVALDGKTLAFIHENQELYKDVIHKILKKA